MIVRFFVRNLSNKSFSLKLVLSFVIFVIIPIYVSLIIFYFQYKNTLDAKIQEHEQQSFELIHYKIDNHLLEMVQASNFIVFNPQTHEILSRDDVDLNWQYKQDLDTVAHLFLEGANISKNHDIYFTLVSQSGRVFGNWSTLPRSGVQQKNWYKQAIEESPFPTWMPLHNSYLSSDEHGNSQMISMVRTVHGLGVLRTSIKQDQISKWLSEITNERDILIYNENGNLMYGDDSILSRQIKERGEELHHSWNYTTTNQSNSEGLRIMSRGLAIQGWTLVQIIDEDSLYSDIHFLVKWSSIIAFLMFVMFILVTVFITNKVTQPLKRLSLAMQSVGEGNWKAEIPVVKEDEVGQLTSHFNDMVNQTRKLIKRLRQEERKKVELHYESLLAQVNPHFLYNSLSSIKWTALISKSYHVADLITSLGKILEMTTTRVPDKIPLEQELSYVEHFMSLQYSRFGERIKLTIDIPHYLQKEIIPKFVIQPLVENAIIHGLEQHEMRGEIKIEGEKKDNYFVIFVKDNGKGITHEKLNKINENAKVEKSILGIGIKNIQERIDYLCGDKYGLIISSQEGKGTIIRLRLPINHLEGGARTNV